MRLALGFAPTLSFGAEVDSFGPMDAETIRAGLKSHDRALHVAGDWIRDPYIVLGPDDFYYLTGTAPLPNNPREAAERYHSAPGTKPISSWKMRLWRSKDLVEWEDLGTPYSLKDGIWYETDPKRFERVDESDWRLWAPEIYFIDGRWAIVHTTPRPIKGGNLSFTKGAKLEGPYTNPMGVGIGMKHDPSLFIDDDGTVWFVWKCTEVAPLKSDFSGFSAEPKHVAPSNRKMGHEGCVIRKIGDKYVLFGTAWSTDQGRKGTYNLYYCTAGKPDGPYGERRFAGRFLGHGTPFQTKDGKWWCTAFFNANVDPISREEARSRSLADNAYSINDQGTTIVPLEVTILEDGDVRVIAKDPDYATPGMEEAQQFENRD